MTLLMLLEMVLAAAADRVAVTDGGMNLTYRELHEGAGRGATELRRRGVRHLVYLARSDVAFPVAIFAAAWAGVPLIPLNYRLADAQLVDLLARHEGVLVLTDDTDRLGKPADEVMSLQEWNALTTGSAATDPPEPSATDGEDIAVLLYTSGTTSEPKAVVLRHRHLASYVVTSIEFACAGEDEAALITVPPYHIAGVANVVTSAYSTRRIVYLADFDATAWLDTVYGEGVTHAMLVPTMLTRVVQHVETHDTGIAALPTLRMLAYGGARMPPTMLRRALKAFPDAGFVNAYGLTETSSTLAVLGPDVHDAARGGDEVALRRLGSAGRLVPGIEIDVRDGEIWVRGEQVSGEYLGRAAALDDDGWFPTRDRGWVDEDGYLFIEGRADDTIIRGAENIAPAEIEDVLLAHPDVIDVAVVGVPDDEWGQVIAAAVVPVPGSTVDADGLRAHARGHLRSSRTPELVVFCDELPHTATGKLLRRAVLESVTRHSGASAAGGSTGSSPLPGGSRGGA